MNNSENSKSLWQRFTNYLVDTTGITIAATPMFAAMESIVSGMSVKLSLESRSQHFLSFGT